MTAQWLLRDLTESGVVLAVDGANLVVEGPPDVVTDDLVARVREAKPGLLAILAGSPSVPLVPRPSARPFGAPEATGRWPIWFQECIVLNIGLGHDRADAERLAFGQAIEAWCQRHHRPPSPETCAGCGRAMGAKAFDCGDGARVCDRSDHACLIRYGTERRRQAALALRDLGIEPPADWTLPDANTL